MGRRKRGRRSFVGRGRESSHGSVGDGRGGRTVEVNICWRRGRDGRGKDSGRDDVVRSHSSSRSSRGSSSISNGTSLVRRRRVSSSSSSSRVVLLLGVEVWVDEDWGRRGTRTVMTVTVAVSESVSDSSYSVGRDGLTVREERRTGEADGRGRLLLEGRRDSRT